MAPGAKNFETRLDIGGDRIALHAVEQCDGEAGVGAELLRLGERRQLGEAGIGDEQRPRHA